MTSLGIAKIAVPGVKHGLLPESLRSAQSALSLALEGRPHLATLRLSSYLCSGIAPAIEPGFRVQGKYLTPNYGKGGMLKVEF